MADAIVSFVLDQIQSLLEEEASLLRGLDEEVNSLMVELRNIRFFLTDAEEEHAAQESAVMRQWLSQVRDIAYDIEDCLDALIREVRDRRERPQGICASLMKYLCTGSLIDDQRELQTEIKSLAQRIHDLSRIRQAYGVPNVSGHAWKVRSKLIKTPSVIREERIVGLTADEQLLKHRILDERHSQRLVISIYGMGGIGKTTLARKLYNSDEVRHSFDLLAWVSVSRDSRGTDLLRHIIYSFSSYNRYEPQILEQLERMDALARYLLEFLSGKKYLLVLDDLWDGGVWESLINALPADNNGSRIILTTRRADLTEGLDEKTFAYGLRSLTDSESWELFCEKAFQNLDDVVIEELQIMGKEMVKRCGGIPLAITVLGRLLSRKTIEEWRRVRDHLWQHLWKDSFYIYDVLALSFEELPYSLKLCFLYLSAYPEDYTINTSQLILLLVAEGFVPGDEGLVEEVAESYLIELADRNLILAERTRKGRISATCRVHALMRELALHKAKEMDFIHVCGEDSSPDFSSSCRRQAVHAPIDRYLSNENLNPRTRSLMFFKEHNSEVDYTKISYAIIYQGFKLLRILHLSGLVFSATDEVSLITLPEGFGELIHLRYFVLMHTNINHLPASIGWLRSLEVFIVDGSFYESIDIQNLKLLRHLILGFGKLLLIDNAERLQTLKYISWDTWRIIKPEEFISLRELRITDTSNLERSVSFHSFANLRNIRVLDLVAESFEESSLEQLSRCNYLAELKLKGVLNKFPEYANKFFPKLERLELEGSEFEEDPMPVLEKLPQLIHLALLPESCIGKNMYCSADGFPQLETLRLLDTGAEELYVEQGAMRNLEVLNTTLSRGKLKIPKGFLENLREDFVETEYDRESALLPRMYF